FLRARSAACGASVEEDRWAVALHPWASPERHSDNSSVHGLPWGCGLRSFRSGALSLRSVRSTTVPSSSLRDSDTDSIISIIAGSLCTRLLTTTTPLITLAITAITDIPITHTHRQQPIHRQTRATTLRSAAR